MAYKYDGLNRLESTSTNNASSAGTTGVSINLKKTYSYLTNSSGKATSLVSGLTYSGVSRSYSYSYDNRGNITKVYENGTLKASYEYDSLGQLKRENNADANKTWVYSYDVRGNITSRKTYAYTTGTLGTVQKTDSYGYYEQWVDEVWNDGLKSYNGSAAFTYDAIGNPLTYNNGSAYTFTWSNGRQLASGTKGTKSFTYTYNSDGLRTSKTVGDFKYSYYWNGSQLAMMTVTDLTSGSVTSTCRFYYDANGTPIVFNYNGTEYYYITNLQGDVIGLADSSGVVVAYYTYDAWGKILSFNYASEQYHSALLSNPLRYRGYIYDGETEFYYLQSRYYDPNTGRFINEDGYVSTGQGLLGYNMYAYCNNNPVNMFDPSGDIAITTLILIGSAVAGVAASGYTAYTSYKYTGEVDWYNTILSGASIFVFCYSYGMSAYGLYVSYCNCNGYAPVTDIGTTAKPDSNPAPYSNLQDPSNVGPGKDFTQSQKAQIIEQNQIRNNGVVRSDLSGEILVKPEKSMKGVTPPSNEWQIDHIIPKSAGGTNSFSNAQVLSREENRIKWDK